MSELIKFEVLTMSSVEVANITGKRHGDVLRDIENLLEQLNEDNAELRSGFISSTYLAGNGKQEKCYQLSHDATVLLMTGYSIPMRVKLVERWRDLEEKHRKPKTALELAKEQVALLEHIESLEADLNHAIKTKAEIGSRREATAMATASAAIRKVNALEAELDKSKDYCTIKRMQMLYHGMEFNWRLLKQASNEIGIAIIDVFDQNYGKVNAYHREVWREVYALEF
jgi:Rha family phage regulatory protein